MAPQLSFTRTMAPFQPAMQRSKHQMRRLVAPVRAEQPDASSSPSSSPQAAAGEQLRQQQPAPSSACPTCGVALADKPSGCDGGRIMGGLGAVPGFGWWPIKAYRPCPKLGDAGVQYQRKGQITDEVLFGRK